MVCEPSAREKLKVYNWTIIQSHSNEKRANRKSRLPKCRASLPMLHEYSKLYQKACERSSKSEITFIPRMGWLRTMKILSYLVLTVLLTNFNQVAGASTVSSLPGLVTINNSTAATASNSNTTIFSRDRSTKVSSERIKGNILHNKILIKNYECWVKREMFRTLLHVSLNCVLDHQK